MQSQVESTSNLSYSNLFKITLEAIDEIMKRGVMRANSFSILVNNFLKYYSVSHCGLPYISVQFFFLQEAISLSRLLLFLSTVLIAGTL